MISNGIRNEFEFVNSLHNKKLSEISFLLQNFIKSLFYNVKPSDRITCYKNVDYEKGDIVIEMHNIKKFISIKMGLRNSVHTESIDTFLHFLKKSGISEDIINGIKRYQYGDETVDGSGKVRMSSTEYKEKYFDEISKINSVLNTTPIIKSCVKRFLIQGTQPGFNRIDGLLYGTPQEFFFIKSNDIYTYIINKINIESSSVHFSCLTFQPLSRVLDYNESNDYRRNWIQIKWYNLEDNIIELMNQRGIKYLNN